MSADDKNRVQFDFSKEGLAALDELQKKMDAGSRAEVVRRALSLLDYAVKCRGQVYIHREDGTHERLHVL